jgi:ubiquinone/menaquinone biosynthesis C-methylase UbiE/DNA-binding transcriptional ArsR family regulator
MAVSSIVKSLRVLGDTNRLRMLLLVSREELSVAELQEILGLGQSSISTHLAQLKHAGLVEDRRTGKNIWYRSKTGVEVVSRLVDVLERAPHELPEAEHDQAALELILRKRQDKTRAFFDDMAGRLGREYVPGRSWQSMAEALLLLLPPMVIADLGAGEGAFSVLLAQRAHKVIAVDNSDRMVELGSSLARNQGLPALEYRKGDLEAVPIDDHSVDVVLFSQSLHHALHPDRAIAEAWRILKPGGRVVILDLVQHRFAEAREMYADVWLGFSEVELGRLLEKAGFSSVHTSVVHKEDKAPFFQTVLGTGVRTSG